MKRSTELGCAAMVLSALLGCAQPSEPPQEQRDPKRGTEKPAPDVAPERWTTPPAAAELEVMESMPEQFAVTLRVQAPSGGYGLRAIGVPLTIRERLADEGAPKNRRAGIGKRFGQPVRTDLRFELSAPPPDTPAITVIEEQSARVDLGTEVTFPIRVLLRRVGEEGFRQVGDELKR